MMNASGKKRKTIEAYLHKQGHRPIAPAVLFDEPAFDAVINAPSKGQPRKENSVRALREKKKAEKAKQEAKKKK